MRQSPLNVLKAQANNIAATIKRAERGQKIDVRFAEKIEAARAKPSLKFAIVMDDRIVTIEMPWATIKTADEAGLAEYVFRQMCEWREAMH